MIKVHDTYDYNTVFTDKDADVYAKLTEDFNPVHLDPEFASKSEFGRPVAQGVLILCAFAKVFGTMWPADKYAYFISQNIHYYRPVYINEPYSIKFECTDVDYKRNIGTIVGVLKDKEGDEKCTSECILTSVFTISFPSLSFRIPTIVPMFLL